MRCRNGSQTADPTVRALSAEGRGSHSGALRGLHGDEVSQDRDEPACGGGRRGDVGAVTARSRSGRESSGEHPDRLRVAELTGEEMQQQYVPTAFLLWHADRLGDELERLADSLTHDEMFWEPVAGSWSVR